MNIVYFDGNYLQESAAALPLSDRGFQHGDGAYATIQVREGAPFFLEEHLILLEKQCSAFNLQMPPLERSDVEELICRNEAFQGIWRLKIFVTGGDSHENRLPLRKGRLIMVMKPFSPLPFKPLKLAIFPIPYWSCHASFKSLAHLNRFYVMEEAHRQNCDDCVTLTESGYLLEAAFGNLIWVREKTIFTPDPSFPLYFGVTLAKTLELAQELGFQVECVKMRLQDLPQEASVYRTNTMQGIRPVAQIGELSFPQNMTVQTLLVNGYERLIEGQKKAAPKGAAV